MTTTAASVREEDAVMHFGVAHGSVYRSLGSRALLAEATGRAWELGLSRVDTWVGARSAEADDGEVRK